MLTFHIFFFTIQVSWQKKKKTIPMPDQFRERQTDRERHEKMHKDLMMYLMMNGFK
jgi:hypothetical protein